MGTQSFACSLTGWGGEEWGPWPDAGGRWGGDSIFCLLVDRSWKLEGGRSCSRLGNMFLLLLRDRFDVLWPGDEERWRGKHAHRQGGDSFVFSSTNLWQERRRQPPGQAGGEGLQAGSGGSCLSSACSCSCSHPPYDCAQAHKDAVLDRMNAELAGARDRISTLELENKELLQEKLDLHASVASFRALNEKLGADLAEFKAASHVGNQTVESLRVEIARLTAEQA